jgi:hypothetical protein
MPIFRSSPDNGIYLQLLYSQSILFSRKNLLTLPVDVFRRGTHHGGSAILGA